MKAPQLPESPPPLLSSLHLENWRQFGDLRISFAPGLTVLVGPNGTGKSTILSLLSLLSMRGSASAPAEVSFDVGRLRRASKSADATRVIGALRLTQLSYSDHMLHCRPVDGQERIGLSPTPEDTFGSFHEATKLLFGRRFASGVFRMLGEMLVPVGGSSGNRAYIASRQITSYIGQLESNSTSLRGTLARQWENFMLFSAESSSLLRQPPDRLLAMLEQRQADPLRVFQRFSEIFVRIVGDVTGISAVQIQDGKLMAETPAASFSFDSLSHGLALVAMLVWDCTLLDEIYQGAQVLIDEPENHLHPGLQRRLMSVLAAEYPRLQFVVATHSPFFVSAAPDSEVCVLGYDGEGKVTARMLDKFALGRSGTADDILREALEVNDTRPLWVEQELRRRVEPLAGSRMTDELMLKLESELERDGMGDLLPEAVAYHSEAHKQQRVGPQKRAAKPATAKPGPARGKGPAKK